MKASGELREKRAALAAESRKILEKAKAEKRNLSAAEQADWDRLMGEIDSMKATIDSMERQEALDLELRSPKGPPPPRNNPGWNPGDSSDADARDTGGWVDERGNPVAVIAPGQRIGKPGASTGVWNLIGDIVRGSGARAERSLLGTSDGAGGFLLDSPMSSEILDAVRAAAVAFSRATIVPMTTSELGVARVDTDATATWAAELVSLPDGAPTFGKILLRARTLRCFVELSQELLDDVSNLADTLRRVLSNALAAKLDAAIIGSSTDGLQEAPVGLRTAIGVNELTGIGSPVYDDWIDAARECRLDNARGPLQAIVHPRDSAVLAKLKDSTGQYLVPPPGFTELEWLPTTAVSAVEGGGTNESFSVVGPLSQVVVGLRMSAQLFLSRDLSDGSKFARGLVCALRADIGIPRPAYFTRLLGIT